MTLDITAVSHIGIRVVDSARSEAFYEKLGFVTVFRNKGGDPVVVLENAAGVEINLIVNADPSLDGKNVLMDDGIPKAPGYTHVALAVASIEETVKRLGELGIPLSGGPMKLGPGVSLFIRDPDRNVVELREMTASPKSPA